MGNCAADPDNGLTSEALIGLLCAETGLQWLPAQHWPIDAALEELASSLPRGSNLGVAIAQMPRSAGPGDRFPGVRPLLRQLVDLGLLTPGGSGWGAGFLVDEDWLRANESLLASLPLGERAALERVGQRLCAMATMASKKPVASRLIRSGTG